MSDFQNEAVYSRRGTCRSVAERQAGREVPVNLALIEAVRKEKYRMPFYRTQFAYTPEAWAALTRNPEDRGAAISALAQSMGCRVLSFYRSFGEYDGLLILEAPDEGTAATIVLVAASAGHLRTLKPTALLSVEDAMEAMRRAGEATFHRPGEQ